MRLRLRCIRERIYSCTDSGCGDLTCVTQAMLPAVLDGGSVGAVWGQSVGGQLLFSFFLRMTGREDRLRQQPLWLWSRSPPPHQDPAAPLPGGNEHGATSALTVLSGVGKLSLALKRLHGLFVMYRFFGISTQHNTTGGWWDISSQLSSNASLFPRAWGQDVGLAGKSRFSMHVSAASVHFASALTFVFWRAFIHEQLGELWCCCITGSVRPQSQTKHPTSRLKPARIVCQTTS